MRVYKISMITLALALICSLAPAAAGAASAASPVSAKVKTEKLNLIFDGRELKLPDNQYSFLYEKRTYVPIRYMSYALQKAVGWDGKDWTVTVQEPTDEELVDLRKQLQLAIQGKEKPHVSKTITMRIIEARLVFNGEEKPLPDDMVIFMHDSLIYVPLRFLAESVGTEVGWDPVTWTVSGESEAYRAQFDTSGETSSPKPGIDDGEAPGASGGTGTGPNPGAGGGGGAFPGTGGGGGPAKPSYGQLTSDAEARLYVLRSSCRATLMSIGFDYLDAAAADKPRIKAQAQQEVDNCSAAFETIISDVTKKLSANGYSTSVIAEYRAEFERELEAGRELAGSMGI